MENNYQDQNQPIYQAAPAYQPIVEEPKKNKVFAIVSLIAGIVSILSCCLYGGNIAFSIAAIVMACIDRAKNGKMGAMSVIGLICGIVGILLGIGWLIYYIVVVAAVASTPSYY